MKVTGWVAALLLVMTAGTAALADIVPNEPDKSSSPDSSAAQTVRGRLVNLGVTAPEAETIVTSLRPEELAFFRANPKANDVVGQDEIVVMFWYEWVFGLAYAYASWKFWDTWGCEAFFPANNCN